MLTFFRLRLFLLTLINTFCIDASGAALEPQHDL